MEMKRLAILCVHTSPVANLGGNKAGGMNVYVAQLAQELGSRGVAVDVFTRRSSPQTPEIDGSLGGHVRVISLPAGPYQALDPAEVYPHLSQFAAGIIAFTTRHQIVYDLVYSHYWLSGWVAAKLKEVWGTPFVHMFHTLGHMKNRVSAAGFAAIADERTVVETQITEWADRIIAATPAEHTQLLWLYRARRKKIVIVPPGVSLERFHPIPQEQAKLALGIAPECNLFLFVGRIEPLKAVDTILEAISLIRTKDAHLAQNMRFAIIGGDPDQPGDSEMSRLMALSRRLDVNDIVDFLGAKDQALLPCYYAAAVAVVMPSDYESFGMVALEAMASGTPVVATEVGGLAFVVRDGETGFLVPSREPSAIAARMATLLEDPERRRKMGIKAAQLAQAYSWERIVDQLTPIFDEVARERRVRC